MSAQTEDWKQKYRELAIEFEQNQGRTQKQESSLGQIISSMVLALEGEDAKLDLELNELKSTINKGMAPEPLSRLSKRLDKQIRARDESRDKNARKVFEALNRWIRQLRTATQHPPMLNVLDSYEKRSEQAAEEMYHLPALLTDLVELQAGIKESPATATDSKPESDDAMAGLNDEEMSRLLQTVANELSALVAGLYLPPHEHEQSKQLIAKIERGFDLAELPSLLRQVIQLVSKVSTTGNEDFESYLRALSSQLSEVETFITESRQDQSGAGENQRKLNQAVRSNVKQMHDVVKSSDDLGELKKAVASQLSHVIKAMDEFKREEDERENRLAQRYDGLLKKVEQMEQETREVQAHMEEERARATTDALTSLPNRAAYDERITETLANWERYKTHFSVVVGDLDFFKRINDTYGHLAGDKVLRLIGKVLRAKLRTTDFVARYGGEEFVIIMPSTQAKEAHQAVDKIRQAIAKSPFNFHGKPVTVTMSFGVTEVQDDDNVESLFSRADEMLYKAKANGRNQACVS